MQSNSDDTESWLAAFDPTGWDLGASARWGATDGSQPIYTLSRNTPSVESTGSAQTSFRCFGQNNIGVPIAQSAARVAELGRPVESLQFSNRDHTWQAAAGFQSSYNQRNLLDQQPWTILEPPGTFIDPRSRIDTSRSTSETSLPCFGGAYSEMTIDWANNHNFVNGSPNIGTPDGSAVKTNDQSDELDAEDHVDREGSLSNTCMFPLCPYYQKSDDPWRLRQHYEEDHLELLICQREDCKFVANSVANLESHCSHAHRWFGFLCPMKGCSFSTGALSLLVSHYRRGHTNKPKPSQMCPECDYSARIQSDLETHAAITGHASFTCQFVGCPSTFSRVDVLERHKITHSTTTKRYPCTYCKKYRGQDGFKRKDHLTQHVRNYHHIGEAKDQVRYDGCLIACPHDDCDAYRPEAFHKTGKRKGSWSLPKESWAFKKMSDYTAHMKKVHNESPFPCPKPGCLRKGGKGYARNRDLIKHQKKEHAQGEELDEEE